MDISEARGIAARIWCEPEHSSKEMDTAFAESIAQVLVEYSRASFIEGRNAAIDNAAMTAYDMGRSDIRTAINALVGK